MAGAVQAHVRSSIMIKNVLGEINMNYSNSKEVNLTDIIGITFKSVEKVGNDIIKFVDENDEKYQMYHEGQCCESVTIEDICGDLQDLVGSPILLAEKICNSGNAEKDYVTGETKINGEWPEGVQRHIDYEESYTWTFYKFSTIKGSVTMRWYGVSNGYYSEEVNFRKETPNQNYW